MLSPQSHNVSDQLNLFSILHRQGRHGFEDYLTDEAACCRPTCETCNTPERRGAISPLSSSFWPFIGPSRLVSLQPVCSSCRTRPTRTLSVPRPARERSRRPWRTIASCCSWSWCISDTPMRPTPHLRRATRTGPQGSGMRGSTTRSGGHSARPGIPTVSEQASSNLCKASAYVNV
jgi:hypothetical protein